MDMACLCGGDASDAESACMQGVDLGSQAAMDVAMRTRSKAEGACRTELMKWIS